MSNALLSVNQLTCYRGDRLLLNQISFNLRAGELLQITGANGSGKTSLLRLLSGLAPIQSGHIQWCGQPIHCAREQYQQQMYYLGHSLGVKSELTVLENLQLNWRKPITADDAVIAQLRQLQLMPYKNTLCRHLSRGQRQRVALMQLMVSEAWLWILDEPFSALDAVAVTQLQQIFFEKLQSNGMIIFTSHQPLTLPTLTPTVIALTNVS